MHKYRFILSIIVGVMISALLAACGQAKPGSEQVKSPAMEKATPPTMTCQVVSMSPTQGPTEQSMFPPVGKDDWVEGSNPNAPMTIIEYSDFQ